MRFCGTRDSAPVKSASGRLARIVASEIAIPLTCQPRLFVTDNADGHSRNDAASISDPPHDSSVPNDAHANEHASNAGAGETIPSDDIHTRQSLSGQGDRSRSTTQHPTESERLALNAIVKFLHFQEEYERPRHRVRKILRRPFLLTDSLLEKLDQTIQREFSKLGCVPTVDAEVTFGLTESESFICLSDLIEYISPSAVPNRLDLRWYAMSGDGTVSRHIIELRFDTGESGWDKYERTHAFVQIKITSGLKEWCVVTKHNMEEHMHLTRIPSLYQCMNVFHDRTFCTIASIVIGFVFLMTAYSIAGRLDKGLSATEQVDNNYWSREREKAFIKETSEIESKMAALRAEQNAVLEKQTVHEQIGAAINVYYEKEMRPLEAELARIKKYYGPSDYVPVPTPRKSLVRKAIDSVQSVGLSHIFSWGALIVGLVLGQRFLPKLAPRSGIAIGSAAGRYADWENTFRFVVFTLIIGGICVPVLRAILL